jgi:hypothetical protein
MTTPPMRAYQIRGHAGLFRQNDLSCPASCRASTSFSTNAAKGVDGRDKPGHDKEDVAQDRYSAWSRIQSAWSRIQKAGIKKPAAGFRRGLNSCDAEHMQVICPTCQIFFERRLSRKAPTS